MAKTTRGFRWRAALMLLALLAFGSTRAAEAPQVFTPQAGFGGYSEGNGTLKILFGKKRSFHVESHGFIQPDGSFRLDQTVKFQGESPRQRLWVLKTISPNHYQATLSEASGPVSGVTEGRRLLLRYRVKTVLVMHQTLELLPDGKTIDNVGRITFLGIPFGHLHETIIRKPPPSGVQN